MLLKIAMNIEDMYFQRWV